MKQRSRHYLRLLSALLCLVTVLALATPVFALPPDVMVPMDGMSRIARERFSDNLPMLRSTVAVHRYADSNSVVIGQLPDGVAVTVLDTQGDFYKIDCYDMTGYVRSALVSQTENGYRVDCGFIGSDISLTTARSQNETILLRGGLYHSGLAQEGVRYRMGGTTPNGFDCSGFTQYVYRQYDIEIPRTCEGQLAAGVIIPKEELQCGDLVLFHRTNHPTALVTHVGMYIGDGKLIHAGSGGITVVELESRYFAEHYLCARRILITPESQHTGILAPQADPIALARLFPG